MKQGQGHFATFCVLVLAAILASPGEATMAGESETHLRDLVGGLPETVERWSKAEVATYVPDDLYRYINGGAELYISFRFETLVSQPYVRDDGAEIRLDIFDMGTPANAFGIFARSAEAVDEFVAPDVESEYAGGLLHFWKGPYYVSMLAYPETESRKTLVRRLAKDVAASIVEASPKPAIVSLLPPDFRVPHSTRYFFHHAWLNEYRFFADENLLEIGDGAEAVMARYRAAGTDGPTAVLVAVQYPDGAAAKAAQVRFTAALLPVTDGSVQLQEDGTWLGCHQADDLLIVVAGAPDPGWASGLMESCARLREPESDDHD